MRHELRLRGARLRAILGLFWLEKTPILLSLALKYKMKGGWMVCGLKKGGAHAMADISGAIAQLVAQLAIFEEAPGLFG